VFNGYADLVAQITIQYRDSFSDDWRFESFAFLFDRTGGGWFTHPVRIQHEDTEERRVEAEDGIQLQDGIAKSVDSAVGGDKQKDYENPNQ